MWGLHKFEVTKRKFLSESKSIVALILRACFTKPSNPWPLNPSKVKVPRIAPVIDFGIRNQKSFKQKFAEDRWLCRSLIGSSIVHLPRTEFSRGEKERGNAEEAGISIAYCNRNEGIFVWRGAQMRVPRISCSFYASRIANTEDGCIIRSRGSGSARNGNRGQFVNLRMRGFTSLFRGT